MMGANLKTEWVAALRSGNYDQAIGVLNNGNGRFCCLGVLCDVLGAQWSDAKYGISDPWIGTTRLDGEYDCLLSDAALELSGMNYIQQKSLVKMNDDGTSFLNIANYIEEHL